MEGREIPKRVARSAGTEHRFGIAEWYGQRFDAMAPNEWRHVAQLEMGPKANRPDRPCPFRSKPAEFVPCKKKGGVCTIRLYEQDAKGDVATVSGLEGGPVTVCPFRFEDQGIIYRWVGEVILRHQDPLIVKEVGFLGSPGAERDGGEVGQIDRILVVPGGEPLAWCALEVQAVYFSGGAIPREWPAIASHTGPGVPFPVGKRRPDYRSSGPKRLMPQLQIKVPSLRRWGKKMAVVVDQSFWHALGAMDEVRHVSNCDIAWFVVGYEEQASRVRLVQVATHLTTLERSVEGLTAGVPVSLDAFERKIRDKIGT